MQCRHWKNEDLLSRKEARTVDFLALEESESAAAFPDSSEPVWRLNDGKTPTEAEGGRGKREGTNYGLHGRRRSSHPWPLLRRKMPPTAGVDEGMK